MDKRTKLDRQTQTQGHYSCWIWLNSVIGKPWRASIAKSHSKQVLMQTNIILKGLAKFHWSTSRVCCFSKHTTERTRMVTSDDRFNGWRRHGSLPYSETLNFENKENKFAKPRDSIFCRYKTELLNFYIQTAILIYHLERYAVFFGEHNNSDKRTPRFKYQRPNLGTDRA